MVTVSSNLIYLTLLLSLILQQIDSQNFLTQLQNDSYNQRTYMDFKPSLEVLTAYLLSKPKLTLNPSYNFDVRTLLMSLNSDSMDGIKQEFHINNNQIDLQKFLWLIKNAWQGEMTDPRIFYQLVKLFEDIDIDGSDSIEWSEFLEFLSESGSIGAGNIEMNRVNNDRKILYYVFKENVQFRKHPIRRVLQIQRSNMIAVVNSDNDLQFLDYEKREGRGKEFGLAQVGRGRVLSVDYAESQRLFGVLMVNRSICFIQDGEIQKNIGVIRPSGTQNDIKYLPLHKMWAVTGHNSSFQLFKSPKNGQIKDKILFKPHQEPLTSISQISSPLSVCTASLDGLIKLWQPGSGRLVIQLSAARELGWSGQQRRGIKGMTGYSNGNISYICSWMFTSQLFLWFPSLSLSKPYAGQLRGHMGLVLDCVFTHRGEIVSLDDKRSVRVWSPQKLQCNQIITVEQQVLKLFVLKGGPYLCVYGKIMHFYRIKTEIKMDLKGEVAMSGKGNRNVLVRGQVSMARLIGVIFSPYFSALVVVTSLMVKIMDVNLTRIIGMAAPPRSDEQYIMLTPKSERRFFIASSKGNIFEYRVQDALMIRMIEVIHTPDCQLKFIYYHQTSKILLAITQYTTGFSQILTYGQDWQSQGVIKQIQFQQHNLMLFQYSTKLDNFFILSESCLTIWSYQRLAIVNRIQGEWSNVVNMWFEEGSGSLIMLKNDGLWVVKMYQCHDIWEIIQLTVNGLEGMVVGGALISKDIQQKYLQHLKTKTSIKPIKSSTSGILKSGVLKSSVLKQKQKLQDSINFLSKTNKSVKMTSIKRNIVMIINSCGEVNFFDISQYLDMMDIVPVVKSKGNMWHVKEKRRVFGKIGTRVDIERGGDLEKNKLGQGMFVHRAAEGGTVNGYFYVFNDDQLLTLVDPFGMKAGQWNVNLNRPVRWSMFYNQMPEVINRLQKGQKALSRIKLVEGGDFKLRVLMSKYFLDGQIKQIKKFQDRMQDIPNNKKQKTQIKGTRYSIKLQSSKQSVKLSSMNDIIGSVKIKTEEKKQDIHQNVFQKKLGQFKNNSRNQRGLESRLQNSIKTNFGGFQKQKDKQKFNLGIFSHFAQMSQPNTQNQIFPSAFLQHLDSFFPTGPTLNIDPHISEVSGRSISKKDAIRRKSLLQRPRTSFASPLKSTTKLRIRSSLADVAKNFDKNKIEYNNFLQRSQKIKKEASSALQKKGRHLKL